MRILAVIAGMLLILLGGGSAFWWLTRSGMMSDLEAFPYGLLMLLVFGVIPILGGWKLLRYGMNLGGGAPGKGQGDADGQGRGNQVR
ncbi:MAG: hypothetical protein U1F47_15320 [Hyphomicrobiales bacterium]